MRIAQFNGDRLGLVVDGGIVDVSSVVPDGERERGSLVQWVIENWASAREQLATASPAGAVPLDRVRLDPPLPDPSKIPSAPSNYRKHIAEMGSSMTIAQRGIFLKATSSVIGPSDTIRIPYLDRRTDHEAELAVVIGSRARSVAEADALDHVFGYTCLLDITVRGQEERSMRKSYDTFTPIGPWIVTADEVPDPESLGVRCLVNGEVRQDGNTRDLIFSVGKLVSFVSGIMTLLPGDVIATGTPAGIGPIEDGDRVAVEIERVGRMELPVSAAGAVPCPFGPDNWTQPPRSESPSKQGAAR